MGKRKVKKLLTFGSSLGAVRLHGDVRVQVVQSAIRLFTTVPAAFVHALNFFISSTWSLVLLCARNGDKGIDGRQRVSALCAQ